MNLLYCRDGVVLGWHDSALNVRASTYGSGVRIIPYDGLMSDLDRIGDPPTVLARDSRPYAEPAPTTALLIGYSAQVRFDMSNAGIVWNSIPVATDRVSQMLIGNLAYYASTLPASTQIDFTQDNVAYPVQAGDVADLFAQVIAIAQNARTVEAQCIADLNSPTPTITTYEDVEARFAAIRARTLLGAQDQKTPKPTTKKK